MTAPSPLKQNIMALCLVVSAVLALQPVWRAGGWGGRGLEAGPSPTPTPTLGTRIEMRGEWQRAVRPINPEDPRTLEQLRSPQDEGEPRSKTWWFGSGSTWALAFFPQLGQSNRVTPPVRLSSVRLRVDLSDRRVYVYPAARTTTQALRSYPVAVAKAGWETPTGSYRIERMEKDPIWQHPLTGRIVEPGPDNPLGAAWIGFWSDTGFHFGFHGTQDESLIGEAVSHGCLRMRNADILALYDAVTPDTLVEVQP